MYRKCAPLAQSWCSARPAACLARRRTTRFSNAAQRENGKYIVFVHPAEFLVTAPNGAIVQRVILGDELKLDDDEIGTVDDSSGVFYCDFQRPTGKWRADPVSQALATSLLDSHQSKQQLGNYVSARIPIPKLPETQNSWLDMAESLRKRVLNEVVFRGEARSWRAADARVEWLGEIDGGKGYRIKKFRYEALPDFWIPALLYEPEQLDEKIPVFINPNGHHRGGKAMPYKQRRCINLARRGILAYNLEFIDMGQLRHRGNKHNRLLQLDLCGTSGVAPFLFSPATRP